MNFINAVDLLFNCTSMKFSQDRMLKVAPLLPDTFVAICLVVRSFLIPPGSISDICINP